MWLIGRAAGRLEWQQRQGQGRAATHLRCSSRPAVSSLAAMVTMLVLD